MTCPTCGAAAPADASTCPTCGAPAQATGQGAATTPPTGSQPPPAGSYPPPGQARPEHHSGRPSEARNWAMASHLSALVVFFFGGAMLLSFVGPLIIWLIRRDNDPFAAEHAREALNFNITFLLVTVVGGTIGAVVAVVTLGIGLLLLIPFFLAVFVGWIVLTIVAAVAAADGREYRYPFTMRLVG